MSGQNYNAWEEIDLRDLYNQSKRSAPAIVYRRIVDANPATNKEINIPGHVIYFLQNNVLDLKVGFDSLDSTKIPVHRIKKITAPFYKFYLEYTQAVDLELFIGRVPDFELVFNKEKSNFSYPLAAGNALLLSAIGSNALIDYILIESFGNLVIENDAGTRTINNMPTGTILENIWFEEIVSSTTCDIEIFYRRR